jgi:hypothetical protein
MSQLCIAVKLKHAQNLSKFKTDLVNSTTQKIVMTRPCI